MNWTLEDPPRLTGNAEMDIAALAEYVRRMNELLEYIIPHLSKEEGL